MNRFAHRGHLSHDLIATPAFLKHPDYPSDLPLRTLHSSDDSRIYLRVLESMS
jgi:hypothetical protein